MANILDYLDWRGDLQISERGFNEVDNLLLAELCYLDFGGIVPPGFDAPVPLQEAMRRYDVLREHESMARHTTFRLGGPVRLMALPNSREQAVCAVRAAREAALEPFFLGLSPIQI